MENKEQWLLLGTADLLLGVGLVLSEKLGVELDVTGLVHTVNVSECGSDGEIRGNRR